MSESQAAANAQSACLFLFALCSTRVSAGSSVEEASLPGQACLIGLGSLKGTPVTSPVRISGDPPFSEGGQGNLPDTESPSLGSGNGDSSGESGSEEP